MWQIFMHTSSFALVQFTFRPIRVYCAVEKNAFSVYMYIYNYLLYSLLGKISQTQLCDKFQIFISSCTHMDKINFTCIYFQLNQMSGYNCDFYARRHTRHYGCMLIYYIWDLPHINNRDWLWFNFIMYLPGLKLVFKFINPFCWVMWTLNIFKYFTSLLYKKIT